MHGVDKQTKKSGRVISLSLSFVLDFDTLYDGNVHMVHHVYLYSN